MRPCRRLQQVQILTGPRRVGWLWTDNGTRDQRRVYDSVLQPQQNAKVVVPGSGTDPNRHKPSSRFKLASKVFRGNEKMQPWLEDDFPSLADAHRVHVQSKNQRPIGKQKEMLTVLAIEPESFVHALKSSGGWEEVKVALHSGATETVIPQHVMPGHELRGGAPLRRGMEFEVANGVQMPNLAKSDSCD